MNRTSFICALLLLLCFAPALIAVNAAATQEIEYLIGYIERSGARFIRGGKEYSAKEGADHMRSKLKKAGGHAATAEDFILNIASKSYLTGEAYQVKLTDGKTVATGPWLTAALADFRKVHRPNNGDRSTTGVCSKRFLTPHLVTREEITSTASARPCRVAAPSHEAALCRGPALFPETVRLADRACG